MLFLCIESATPVCSVALLTEKGVLEEKNSSEKNAHSRVLTVFIQELFEAHNLDVGDLTAVSVSKGPGSYTGLRIGVSAAKGLCYAGNIPLMAINTLASMAAGTIKELGKEHPKNTLYCPMIDARRMEVYSALFDASGKEIRETRAEIIEAGSFDKELKDRPMVFFGDGADKCSSVITAKNASFISDFQHSASNMADLVLEKYSNQQFEDVAYFEPFYLKDFVAGVPKVKGLRG
jgi:tRNA threonylcarbamoyladenosine biosynthesis protein TsaB